MNVLRDYYTDVKSKTNIRHCLYVKLKKMTQAYSQNRLKQTYGYQRGSGKGVG